MLAADELRQLRGIGVAHESEALRSTRSCHALDDFLGLLLAKRPHQHFAGVIGAARGDEVARDRHVVALFEDLAFGLFGDLLELEDLEGERLDLALSEVLEHLRRDVRAECNQQCRRLLATLHTSGTD